MIITRTNETLQGRMYYEWLNTLSMYQQELEHIDQLVDGNAFKNLHLDASIELEAFSELIKVQKKQLEDLTTEVLEKNNQAQRDRSSTEGVMAFTEVIRNNQLREKIRKAEHSVFYLKYNVNKLLSIAS